VIVDVEVPFATIDVGLAVIADVAVEAGPGLTVRFTTSLDVPPPGVEFTTATGSSPAVLPTPTFVAVSDVALP